MRETMNSVSVLPIVGVIGSGNDIGENKALADQAEAVGRMVAEAGYSLLTGGGGGVMSVVSQAFVATPYRVGRSIGVVPGTVIGDTGVTGPTNHLPELKYAPKSIAYPNRWIEIPLFTHLPGAEEPAGKSPDSRNFINILTSDVVVALAGGTGTKAELEIGAQLNNKPVIALLNDDQSINDYARNSLPSGVSVTRDVAQVEEFIIANTIGRRLARPSFNDLRAHYRFAPARVHECTVTLPNTGALGMSEALATVAPEIIEKFVSSGRNICPHGYMRGAQDLALVLRQSNVFGRFEHGFEAPGSAPAKINSKPGLVCFMNVPGYPDGQGHIDLWDGSQPVGDAYWAGNPIWFWSL